MNSSKIKDYLKKNAQCLNIRGIERAAGIPKKTLDHFLNGRRELKREHIALIMRVIRELQQSIGDVAEFEKQKINMSTRLNSSTKVEVSTSRQ